MKLILAGGFLGSGKTTAIVHACQLLKAEGKRVAMITNDQGDQQVDSVFAKSLGISTREVSNGCFCCRYDELDYQLTSLEEEQQPDIVFAESVGSCTDIIATVARPLLRYKSDINIVVSVFADVHMLVSLIEGRASFLEESVRYIYKKQLEEADLIILNKVDLITKEQLAVADELIRREYPGKTIVYQNSLKDEDIVVWLDTLDHLTSPQHRDSLTIDYDVYGEGEGFLCVTGACWTGYTPSGDVDFVSTLFGDGLAGTPPRVAIVAPKGPTRASSFTWWSLFDKPVAGLTASDFTKTGSADHSRLTASRMRRIA